MRVLILTAGYGEGHNAAARGLLAAFTAAHAEAEIADLFAITGGVFYDYSRRGYVELINRAPQLWALAFQAIDRWPVVKLSATALPGLSRALAGLLADKRPDVVLSVYPVYGYLIENLYPQADSRPFSFHTVITDSITVNSAWHRCASDTFLVPNEETAGVLRAAEVAANKIHALGFPVSPRFADERPVREAPGPNTPPRVLFMINAGRDKAVAIVRELLEVPRIELTVTTGRDDTLGAQIGALAGSDGRRAAVHGWTDRMAEFLMSHHVLIGKAGGATVQETIAAQTPMLITQIVPGQEEGNAELLFRNQCGALAETPAALAGELRALFSGDAARWRQWAENIARLSKPDAARDIARFALAFASPRVAP